MTTSTVDSNAVTLLQMNKHLNAKQRGWIRTFTEGYDLSAAIPMVQPNTVLGYKWFEELEGVTSNFEFRALNENVTGSTEDPFVEKEMKASFLASMIPMDYRMNQADPGALDRLIDYRMSKLPGKLTYNLINGSSSTSNKNFVGLKEACTGDYLIGPGGALDIDSSEANFRDFMHYWWLAEDTIIRDGATEVFAIMNRNMWLSINQAILLYKAYALGSEHSNVLNTTKRTLSTTFIHVVRNGDASDAVLPYTETSSTSSIYFIGVSDTRKMDPDTGRMPNGVFAVSDGLVNLRGQVDGFVDKTYMDLMYAPVFPTGSAVRLKMVL
jgi:hypothetical protein